jgi:hypothetical protein
VVARLLLPVGAAAADCSASMELDTHCQWLQLQADDYSAWVSLQTLRKHPDSLLAGLADTAVSHGRDKLRLDMSPDVAQEVVSVLRLGEGYVPPDDSRLVAALQVSSWQPCHIQHWPKAGWHSCMYRNRGKVRCHFSGQPEKQQSHSVGCVNCRHPLHKQLPHRFPAISSPSSCFCLLCLLFLLYSTSWTIWGSLLPQGCQSSCHSATRTSSYTGTQAAVQAAGSTCVSSGFFVQSSSKSTQVSARVPPDQSIQLGYHQTNPSSDPGSPEPWPVMAPRQLAVQNAEASKQRYRHLLAMWQMKGRCSRAAQL